MVFLNIYNCAYKIPFANPVTNNCKLPIASMPLRSFQKQFCENKIAKILLTISWNINAMNKRAGTVAVSLHLNCTVFILSF